MNPLYAIILGLVEGVSEWLPISSKTQTPSRYCPTRGLANWASWSRHQPRL